MNYKEIIKKESAEIKSLIAEKRIELSDNRFKNSINDLKDTSQIKKARKELARLKTALNEKGAKVD